MICRSPFPTLLILFLSFLLPLAAACSRELPVPPPAEEPAETSPEVPEQIEIPDPVFRAWVLSRFDTDEDGVLSAEEAASIETVEFSTEDVRSLDGLQYFPSLSHLSAGGRRVDGQSLGLLTEVDLGSNRNLRHIHLIQNRISTLKLGDHPELDYLDVDYNEISTLDVRDYSKLSLLQVSGNRLKTIDVRGLDALTEFDCDDNPLEEILLDNACLESFRCAGTLIRRLDLSSCPRMNNVCCSSCPNLTVVILAKGQVLGNLTCDDNVKIEYHE